jgi:uncharacterized membrane protein YkoI
MKRKLLSISAACTLVATVGSFQARADHIPLTQLPERVQQAIKSQSQGETLEHVDRDTKDGQTVYQAEFKREGLNRRVTFDANGQVLPDRSLTARVENTLGRDNSPSVALNTLPAAVQKTIKEQQGGREVADIDKEMWNGKTVYEVEFKEKGPNSRIYIGTDGSMVVDKEKSITGRVNTDKDRTVTTRAGTYYGTQLSEAPAAVQATVKKTVSSAAVEDVDRETRDGRVYYDVEVKQEGLNRHLQIAEDGTLLNDSNNNTSRESRSIGERVRETVGLGRNRADENLTLDQVPAAVQKTIRENAAVGSLKPIKRETRDGRIQYDVEYEKEGKNLRMTVNEDGTVVKDNIR